MLTFTFGHTFREFSNNPPPTLQKMLCSDPSVLNRTRPFYDPREFRPTEIRSYLLSVILVQPVGWPYQQRGTDALFQHPVIKLKKVNEENRDSDCSVGLAARGFGLIVCAKFGATRNTI